MDLKRSQIGGHFCAECTKIRIAFASDFYRRRGYRREFRSEGDFHPLNLSLQKKLRFASDFLRRGNRAYLGASKNRDFWGSGKNRRCNRRESRDFSALSFCVPIYGNPQAGLLRNFWEPNRVLRHPLTGLSAQDVLSCLTKVSRALRAQNAKKRLENVSRNLRPWNPEKSPKSLGNSPERLFLHFPETLRRLPRLFPRLFWRLFGVPGQRPRETFSRRFLAFWARRSREISVRGGLVRNPTT